MTEPGCGRRDGVDHRVRQWRADAVRRPGNADEAALGEAAGEPLDDTEDHRQWQRMRGSRGDTALDELGEGIDRQVDHGAGREAVDGVDEDDGCPGPDEVVRHERADVADLGQRSRGGGQRADDPLGDRVVAAHGLAAHQQRHASHHGHRPVTLRSRKWVAQLMHGS